MPGSVHEALEQLASLSSSEYFSLQPGLLGRPILSGTLYARTALQGLLGGRVPCMTSERDEIISRIAGFLNKNIESFERSDLPQLTRLEYQIRRMEADEGHAITGIYQTICTRFTQVFSHDEKIIPAAAPSAPAPTEAAGTQKVMADAEVLVSRQEQDLASCSKNETTPCKKPESPTLSDGSKLGDGVHQPPVKKACIMPEELFEAFRTVNTHWFFPQPLTPPTRTSCEKLCIFLHAKLLSHSSLDKEEWMALARGSFLLLKDVPEGEFLQRAQETFLCYYLRHNKSSTLPEEFLELFHHISAKTHVRELVAFFRTASVPPSIGTPLDPNGSSALKTLLEEYTAFRWQDAPISITGFASTKPWRVGEEALSDQAIITRKCHELLSLDPPALKDQLDTVTLVLLFALSSHTFRENAPFRKGFRKLAQRFPAIVEILGRTPPKDMAESICYSNFRRLYQFFTGTKFMTRLCEEERPCVMKDTDEKKEAQHSALGERFSLWGFKEGSRELAGNIQRAFDFPSLLVSLEEVRQVAIRESRLQKKPRTLPMGAHFTITPPTTTSLLLPTEKFSWDGLFHEPIDDPRTMWNRGQEVALHRAQELVHDFARQFPPIDFESIVRAAQRGGDILKRLLSTYDDGGLALLREYIYPYVVLMRRASTPFEHEASKFIGGAASPEEIASLAGENAATQVAVLQNALYLMRERVGDDPGGYLSRSVIHSNQIDMLSHMIRCIESGKTVYICNETGSGKTTMSKLAPLIVSLHVPMVLHVAPFSQSEKGWKRLTSWEDLNLIKKGETSHFWITASDLAQMLVLIPKKFHALLRNSFFLMDEYDSQEYLLSLKDEYGNRTPSSIQDELFFRYNCPRIVNMSATPNLETLDTCITHYTKKRDEAVQREVAEQYQKRIYGLGKQREELLSSMAIEWKRRIDVRDLTPSAGPNPLQQIETVFHEIKALPLGTATGASLLVEMPQFTLQAETVSHIRKCLCETFDRQPSALLFRDATGLVQAHLSLNGKTWTEFSLGEFSQTYFTLEKKPIVVCFYSQDSVGGDFDIFSNERLVRGQFIVYAEEIAPSYAIFQNMRRQRRNLASMVRQPSETPVMFFLGPNVSSLLTLSPEEERHIRELPPEQHAAEINSARKTKLFSKAALQATRFSRVRELARLKTKVLRKKQHLCRAVLQEDAQRFSQVILETLKDRPLKDSVASFFQSSLTSLIDGCFFTCEQDIEGVRKELLTQAIATLHKPILAPILEEISFQEQEAIVLLEEVFGGSSKLEEIKISEDPYQEIHKVLTRFYQKRPPSCTDLFKEPLEALAIQKKDPLLHPIPSPKAISAALQRIRLGNPEGIARVDEPIDPGPVRHGLKPLPPDLMVKALLGVSSHDKIGAKSFCSRLQTEATRARAFQNEQQRHIEDLQRIIRSLQSNVLQFFEPTSHSRLPSIADLSCDPHFPAINAKARQLEVYWNTYQLYAQK